MKRLFWLATLLFLFSNQLAIAEVTSPYTIDEKSQVLFGDSTEVIVPPVQSGQATSTYNGLENYTNNYVNNYLHITFTYTHHRCCFASYPPRLYVTALDPRFTTTPTIRDQQTIYELEVKFGDFGHETDWYSYDIQFDATGYTATVLQGGDTTTTSFHRNISGLTTTDWVALVNLYPKQDPVNSSSMSFTPLAVYNAPVVPVVTTTPVIIVPGITSSVLKDNTTEKWPNLVSMSLSFEDLYLEDLSLGASGEYSGSISPTSLIRNIGSYDFFSGLFSTLDSKDYDENEESFEFPYDWRIDIEESAQDLKEKIDTVKAARGVDRVDLVAHSMGGLLVKKYLKDYGGSSVDKFIDVGTPHTGAPKAFKILSYGDNFGFEKFGLDILSTSRTKTISQNMPAVYQLLPSRDYFDDSSIDYKYYVFNGTSGNDRYTFDQTSDYLKSSGRNSALVDRAKTFHDEIDNLNPADYGVDAYNIVGCGTPTIGQFYILEDGEHPIYNIRMINGDGTVPLKSAEAMTATSTYYVRNAQHALMPSTTGVKELIAEILTSTSTLDFDISLYSNLSTSSSGCTIPDGRIVSFHSPIELHIYDSSGNHVGPDSNGDIENEISGVIYEVLGDNKFAFLPNGTNYTVKGSATSAGEFDVRIQELVNGEVATTTLWTNVALTPTTQTQFTINSNTPAQIELDHGNDGVYEQPLNVSSAVAGIVESTGEVAVATNSTSSSGSSGSSVSTSSEPILEVVTSTGEVLGVASTSSSQTAQSALIPKVVKTPKALERNFASETLEADQANKAEYSNIAIAYKSLNLRLKIAFLKMLLWVKSR